MATNGSISRMKIKPTGTCLNRPDERRSVIAAPSAHGTRQCPDLCSWLLGKAAQARERVAPSWIREDSVRVTIESLSVKGPKPSLLSLQPKQRASVTWSNVMSHVIYILAAISPDRSMEKQAGHEGGDTETTNLEAGIGLAPLGFLISGATPVDDASALLALVLPSSSASPEAGELSFGKGSCFLHRTADSEGLGDACLRTRAGTSSSNSVAK